MKQTSKKVLLWFGLSIALSILIVAFILDKTKKESELTELFCAKASYTESETFRFLSIGKPSRALESHHKFKVTVTGNRFKEFLLLFEKNCREESNDGFHTSSYFAGNLTGVENVVVEDLISKDTKTQPVNLKVNVIYLNQ